MLKTPKIRLAADGKKYSARATPITDAAKVHAVVENFRAKYGAGDVRANYPKLNVAVEVAPAYPLAYPVARHVQVPQRRRRNAVGSTFRVQSSQAVCAFYVVEIRRCEEM